MEASNAALPLRASGGRFPPAIEALHSLGGRTRCSGLRWDARVARGLLPPVDEQ